MQKGNIVRWTFWLYDQFPCLHRHTWEEGMGNLMRRLRRQPVCILAKTDEVGLPNMDETEHLYPQIIQINRLIHKLQYVCRNEETSCLKLAHFYNEEEGIPSEMEANWKSTVLFPSLSQEGPPWAPYRDRALIRIISHFSSP